MRMLRLMRRKMLHWGTQRDDAKKGWKWMKVMKLGAETTTHQRMGSQKYSDMALDRRAKQLRNKHQDHSPCVHVCSLIIFPGALASSDCASTGELMQQCYIFTRPNNALISAAPCLSRTVLIRTLLSASQLSIWNSKNSGDFVHFHSEVYMEKGNGSAGI